MSTIEIPAGNSPLLEPLASERKHEHAGHAVQFYSDDEFLLDGLSRLVGTSLGAGDAAIVIATKAHEEGLSHRLKARGFDPAASAARGRFISLDASETLAKFMVAGVPDFTRFLDTMGAVIARATAAADNHRVVMFGEMVALLWAQGKAEASLQLERLWNELARKYAFSLQCAYPIAGFCRPEHNAPLLQICAEHSSVIPVESYTSLSNEEDRLRLITELQQKAQALESEMAERLRVQDALLRSQEQLQKSHEELEKRVRDRAQDLIQAEGLLRKLSHTLLTLRDEERRRIARELHDSTGQILTALQLNLASAQRDARGLDAGISKKLADAISLGDQAINEIRTMSYLLHPPMLDESGLRVALEWYVDGFAERTGLKVALRLPGTLKRLSRDLELAIFRIVQEALTNVHRHSGSKTASVELVAEAGRIKLTVQDAGRGIPKEKLVECGNGIVKMGVGLAGMRERVWQFGGKFELTSTDPGTRLMATFPLNGAGTSTPADSNPTRKSK